VADDSYDKMQMRYCGDEELDESPFDEPPVSAEIDLDRMVEALTNGSPPSKVFHRLSGSFSVTSSLPHDEPRRQPKRQHKQRHSSARWNQRQNSRSKGRRISFAKKLVDVVPEEFGEEFGVKRAASSIASPDFEDETYASFISFENSLEYFLQGEWIRQEMDDLIFPVNCNSPKAKSTKTRGGERNSSHWYDCLGLLDPAEYSSKPLSEPFKWKEYTTLDAECLDVELCRNEGSLVKSDHGSRRRLRTKRSFCSEDDDVDVEEALSLTTARNSVTNSLREMLPPLESFQTIFGRFFAGSSTSAKKQAGQKGKNRNDDDTMSMYSDDSTLANTSAGLRVNVTAE
jgi:hypothetical protein